MNYFDKSNESMKPYVEYGSNYVFYRVDSKNKAAGLELYFDSEDIEYYEKVIDSALRTAFEEHELNKVYINVIRDNYAFVDILKRFNFIAEAIHRGQYYDGVMHDVVYMTVMKTEWQLGGIRYNYKYDTYDVDIV